MSLVVVGSSDSSFCDEGVGVCRQPDKIGSGRKVAFLHALYSESAAGNGKHVCHEGQRLLQ